MDPSVMQTNDLLPLLEHFDKKINLINQTIPWARFCNHVIREHEQQMMDTPDANRNVRQKSDTAVVDVNALTALVVEMESCLLDIENHLTDKKKKLLEQEQRILVLLEDVAIHLEYLSSNFPIDFGKSPEKPKPKYGINTGINKRHTVATSKNPVNTNRGLPSKPNAAGGNAVKGSTTNTRPGTTASKVTAVSRPTAPTSTASRAPASGVNLGRKEPVAATKEVVGKKAPIPVRMNKKILSALEHNKKKI
jgi:hypothetical protein